LGGGGLSARGAALGGPTLGARRLAGRRWAPRRAGRRVGAPRLAGARAGRRVGAETQYDTAGAGGWRANSDNSVSVVRRFTISIAFLWHRDIGHARPCGHIGRIARPSRVAVGMVMTTHAERRPVTGLEVVALGTGEPFRPARCCGCDRVLPVRIVVRGAAPRSGKFRASGKIQCTIVRHFLPDARLFPDNPRCDRTFEWRLCLWGHWGQCVAGPGLRIVAAGEPVALPAFFGAALPHSRLTVRLHHCNASASCAGIRGRAWGARLVRKPGAPDPQEALVPHQSQELLASTALLAGKAYEGAAALADWTARHPTSGGTSPSGSTGSAPGTLGWHRLPPSSSGSSAPSNPANRAADFEIFLVCFLYVSSARRAFHAECRIYRPLVVRIWRLSSVKWLESIGTLGKRFREERR
jgi:hypothetical protein